MKKAISELAIILGLVLAAAAGVSRADTENAAAAADEKQAPGTLSITNESGKTTTLSPEDFAKLPRQTLKAKDHSGASVTYEGVSLAEILRGAGVTLGKDLRGPLMANCLLVEAADGYRVVFALPEIDPANTDNIVLVADRKDGKPLDRRDGAYKLVVPADRRQARWVRQVTQFSIQRVGGTGRGTGQGRN
jgi:hypothetical protein